MGTLRAPRFYGDPVLAACLDDHRIEEGGGDPLATVSRLQQAFNDLGDDLLVDGIFGPATAKAVQNFKISLGLFPQDPRVGPKTITALDNAFAHELFDLKAAELMGTLFDPGQRTGDRQEEASGVATCQYANGTIIEIGKLLTLVVPASCVDTWNGAGGLLGEAGIPTSDPYLRDDGTAMQDFTGISIIDGTVVVSPVEREVLDWTSVGTPIDNARATSVGGMITPCSAGAIIQPGDGTAIPLPQSVVDAWLPAINELGMPTALGFADTDTSTVFPFVGGSLVSGPDGSVVTGATSATSSRRFFMPADPAKHLQPAVAGSGAEHLVGGNVVLGRIADDIARASGPDDFVYIASWNCELDLQLPASGAPTTVRKLLSAAVGAGAQVRMQLWAGDPTIGLPSSVSKPLSDPLWFARQFVVPLLPQSANNLNAVNFVDTLTGDSAAILDSRYLMFGSHHQKIVVVFSGGQLVSYVGGVEVSADRLSHVSNGSPLFDLSVRLTGPAAHEVLRTFVERWQAHPTGHGVELRGMTVLSGPPAVAGSVTAQITHTYGRGFPYPVPVQTAAAARAQALGQARAFFYMEDQYFVGSRAQDAAMRKALNAGAVGIVVIAAEDSVGDLPDIGFRRRKFLGPLVQDFPGQFLVFERLGHGSTTGEGAYVHSKVLIVDDEVAIVGSVNSNRRSWTHDSEIDSVFVDDGGPGDPNNPGTWGAPRRLRTDLWAAHLGVPGTTLGFPAVGITAFQVVAVGAPNLSSLRIYNALANVSRFMPPLTPPVLFPFLPQLLDFAWDTAEDPAG